MGSYNRFYISCSSNDDSELNKIIKVGREIDDGSPHWDICAFKKWSSPSKWWPYEFINDLSKRFPNVIFSVSISGESANYKKFILNGVELNESVIFPKPSFPTIAQFNKAKKLHDKQEEKNTAVKKELQKKQKAENEKKRIVELTNSIKSAKEELKKLK